MLDVYRSFYHFCEQPFRLSPDSRFSFGHRSYENAFSYLKYAISEGEGIVTVTGAPGTGKTTLIGTLLEDLNTAYVRVAMLESAQIQCDRLFDTVTAAFDVCCDATTATKWQQFEQFLREGTAQGRRNILIVDEAQTMTRKSLEELRLLSNMHTHNQLLLQIFLIGQESLLEMVRAPGMEQLHQRLIAAAHLEPLTKAETVDYVEHRLRKSGWQGDPEISSEVMSLIYKFSTGVPRRINLICHRLFLYGGLKKKHQLVGQDALHVVVELHREGLLPPVTHRV